MQDERIDCDTSQLIRVKVASSSSPYSAIAFALRCTLIADQLRIHHRESLHVEIRIIIHHIHVTR